MKRNPVRFSFEERRIIEKGIHERKSWTQLGILLNRHYKSISNEVAHRSKDGVYTAEIATRHSLEQIESRRTKLSKQFSKEEKDYIISRHNQGVGAHFIGREIGSSERTVKRYLQTLSPSDLEKIPTVSLLEKVSALEEQIKTLFEIIKEMSNAKNK